MASLTDEMAAKASGNAKKVLSEVIKMEENRRYNRCPYKSVK